MQGLKFSGTLPDFQHEESSEFFGGVLHINAAISGIGYTSLFTAALSQGFRAFLPRMNDPQYKRDTSFKIDVVLLLFFSRNV